MIYVSTGGFKNKTFKESSESFRGSSIKALELSAGIYTPDLINDLEAVRKDFYISLHNYFPVPEKPFVFNLASSNEEIKNLSITHAKKAITLSAKFDVPYYSFHAGYLLDPQVNELGGLLKQKKLIDRNEGMDNFLNNVGLLSIFAAEMGVKLLIENNVLSYDNNKGFKENPLLMVEEKETEYIFKEVDKNVSLLIDVAHLKVSANSLGFSPSLYVEKFSSITEAYHLSDNDGTADTNNKFSVDAWFFSCIRPDVEYYSIEVYDEPVSSLEKMYLMVDDWISNNNEVK